jgi:membrane fusion protein, multidrug efflux system
MKRNSMLSGVWRLWRQRCVTGMIAMVVTAILIMGCAIGCQNGDGGGDDADSTAAAADTSGAKLKKKEKAIKVNIGDVRQGSLVMPIYADGVIRTPREVEVRSKLGGELTEVLVRDGDQVTAGQLLARVDQRQYRLALEESRYSHVQALSQLAAEDDQLEVNHEALNRFVVLRDEFESRYLNNQISLEEYQAGLLEAELAALDEGAFRQWVLEQRTGLADARTAEARAKLNLENTEIRAPFDGVVQGMAVVPGEYIGTNTTVCSIYDNSQLEAVVNVLEADLGNLEIGRPALLAIPATGDTLKAEIDVISPRLDETTRTCEVLVRFDNPDGRYRPGMFTRAKIAGWIHIDKLMVPKVAVLTRDNRPLVFKVVDDRAQWLYVDIGMENENWIEILRVHSGGSLAHGEQVVVSDHLTLAHEAKINIRKTKNPTDYWGLDTKNAELVK